MSEWEFKRFFEELAQHCFEHYYPDEYVPSGTISVGNIYENYHSFNCQIKFFANGVIMKCSLEKKTGHISTEIYKMDHYNYSYYQDNGNVYFDKDDHIDEINEKNKKTQEEDKQRPKSMLEGYRPVEPPKPRCTMKKRKKKETTNDNN